MGIKSTLGPLCEHAARVHDLCSFNPWYVNITFITGIKKKKKKTAHNKK